MKIISRVCSMFFRIEIKLNVGFIRMALIYSLARRNMESVAHTFQGSKHSLMIFVNVGFIRWLGGKKCRMTQEHNKGSMTLGTF